MVMLENICKNTVEIEKENYIRSTDDNKYWLDGQSFSSIKALAAYVGINEKTITARLRRGMSVEEACETRDFRSKYISYKGKEMTLSEICDMEDKNKELVTNRLRYGYSLSDALNKPKKISRQGKPIVVNGVLYNSVSAACRKLGLENRESTIRSRLRLGKSIEEAFDFEK